MPRTTTSALEKQSAAFRQRFVSTRGGAEPIGLARAVLAGPALDGGLLVPETLNPFATHELDTLDSLDFVDLATAVAIRLLGSDISAFDLGEASASAFDFPLPLRTLGTARAGVEPARVLELFWGPTLAFKDIGARFMAQLLSWAKRQDHPRDDRTLTILVATSGDTGSAVAHAFEGLPGFRVVVLFPRGQVSLAQQKLFTTLGRNVVAIEVDGTFDDCQRLAKQAFADEALRELVPLGSANSINIARLLPQSFYYFWIRNQLVRQLGEEARQRPLVICTPSGNFGNLTAGLLARALGLEVERFVAATNANDVVPEFLEGSTFHARPSVATVANAMDVGNPSNFERMRWLHSDHDLRRLVRGRHYRDHSILLAMRSVYDSTGEFLDPHSAIGYLAATEDSALGACSSRASTGGETRPLFVFLATAHPAKFAEIVYRATGQQVPLPAVLARALQREELVISLPADYSHLRTELLAGAQIAP